VEVAPATLLPCGVRTFLSCEMDGLTARSLRRVSMFASRFSMRSIFFSLKREEDSGVSRRTQRGGRASDIHKQITGED
jgi:hypothetical protein